MVKIGKTLYLDDIKIKEWEHFCEVKFKSRRVLSKIIEEAMEQYIANSE